MTEAPSVTAGIPKLPVRTGDERTEVYFPLLQGKHFAVVVNQTSCLRVYDSIHGTAGQVHLIDTLCHAGLRPDFIFAPEHGFRGDAGAGAHVKDGVDPESGLRVISLYGSQKKPQAAQMQGLDAVVFDIQDVGCRFYTYLSTLHYVMEACAENHVPLILLDRPNPNDTIDGPVLKEDCRSFVGMHPIPVLHGCTLGELAGMIQGEKWIDGDCELTVIGVEHWRHGEPWSLAIKPSPNLPNDHAIAMYPSLCLFEGTVISVGRGTLTPFEVVGYPDPKFGSFTFTPLSLPGFDLNPMYRDKTCYGMDLRESSPPQGFSLNFLLQMYGTAEMGDSFFSNPRMFDLLAGTHALRQQIRRQISEEDIRLSWQEELSGYRLIRNKYLLY